MIKTSSNEILPIVSAHDPDPEAEAEAEAEATGGVEDEAATGSVVKEAAATGSVSASSGRARSLPFLFVLIASKYL